MPEPKAPYVPVPVEAARRVAREFSKSVVVIFAWDEAHDRAHTATYGVTPRQKTFAAELGQKFAAAAGCEPLPSETHEDFRNRTEAEAAAEIERLRDEVAELRRRLGAWGEVAP
jgi:hypothetical protein